MSKRILVIYAPYGSGHKSIALKIANYISENSDYEVKVLDVAKYSNLLGKISVKLFDLVISRGLFITFSFIYDIADNKLASLNQMQTVKRAFDNKKLREEVVDFNPDITISTHFFGGNIISYYNKLGLINSKIISVVTDYVTHSFWRRDHVNHDAIIVANSIMKNNLVKKGISSDKIYDFGIPFDFKKMSVIKNKNYIIKKYNIDSSKLTFLFFGGGAYGNLKSYDYFKKIVKCNYPINLIFISGKNQKLEEKCRSYVIKNNIKNVHVLGFVSDIYSLLNVSDVVITKPGGATLTECINMRVPLILIPGNGGPEKYNARYIVKNKYGCKVYTPFKLVYVIKIIINNKKIINKWTSNLSKCDKNESTKRILELIDKM